MFADGATKVKYSVSNGNTEDIYSKNYNNRVYQHQHYELFEIEDSSVVWPNIDQSNKVIGKTDL